MRGPGKSMELLVDTGADRTVICAHVFDSLGLEPIETSERIGGVGGEVDSVIIRTQIRLSRDDGQKAIFRSDYSACTESTMLDMSVLGRDILDMFALLVDRSSDVVAIFGGKHSYSIHLSS